jgi:hypothetical protein
MSEIRDDRFADIGGQRQLEPPAALATHAQGAILPVDILELEKRHFTGTQTQPRKQQQDRIVASPDRGVSIDSSQQPAHLIGCIARGIDDMDRFATSGTAAARSNRISPRYRPYCRNERNAVVSSLAVFKCSRGARRCTNRTTSPAHSCESLTGPLPKQSLRNSRINGT